MPGLSLPCPFECDVSLASKSYYGIGGRARFLVHPGTPAELADLLLWNREYQLPLAIMGKGSNILFSDSLYPGIVISLDRMQRMFWISDDELFCESGADNTLIAEELLTCGRKGGEWLYRLPGQIGSTVRMNARCFGGEISAVTTGVQTMTIDGRLHWQTPDEVFHGYKHTSLMDNPEIVIAVLLRFPETSTKDEIKCKMDGYLDERTKKHHFDFPSCGSTFKNNYAAGRSSGTIFEELGFKGRSEGGAMVSGHHANFIFNKGGATATEVLGLAAQMKIAAQNEAGVQLDLEVQCIGLFDQKLLASCGVKSVSDDQDPSKGWAGLLWSPQEISQKMEIPELFFPQVLIEGSLVGYRCADREIPPGVFVAVEQLRSIHDAIAAPQAPFFRWTTRCSNSALFSLIPPSGTPPGMFTEGLWQYGVSELFIAHPDSSAGYLEFEMTPEGNWVALRFDAPRKRSNGYAILSEERWMEDINMVKSEGYFGMEFSYKLLEPFINGKSIAMQCCVSSGRGEYGLFPWWDESTGPADFHQPDHFYPITLL